MVMGLDDVGKLGQGFTSINELKEIDWSKGGVAWLTYIKVGLPGEHRESLCCPLWEFVDCFAWDYTEMPGLSRDLAEHTLLIKRGFKPYKQLTWNYNPELLGMTKEEVERLLKENFIWTCRYADWVSNIVLVEKKGTGKIRVSMDFRNLNRATPKDEYPMHVADALINRAWGHKVISFLDGNVGYNQIFMVEEDVAKTAFRCPGFVGLFERVVMIFGLKNAKATYQHAMNLIFHVLLGIILEIYIDGVVIKSASFEGHLADLRVTLERMRTYNLKMNPLKCTFGVSVGKFLGFVVHEKRIEIDP
jgi:hypothetical protein